MYLHMEGITVILVICNLNTCPKNTYLRLSFEFVICWILKPFIPGLLSEILKDIFIITKNFIIKYAF